MIHFNFATASQIIFGPDSILKVPDLIAKYGHRLLVVTGHTKNRFPGLMNKLDQNYDLHTISISNEPTADAISEGVRIARKIKCNILVGIGGGSVIDSGKAISALATNPGDLLDYLEVVGKGLPLQQSSLPYIALPTTAGTGSEVTKNAVITLPKHQVKVSLRSPLMIPKYAVIDPVLTYTLPPNITANTGLDALTQLLEAYVTHKKNPLTDAICCEGLQRAARSLELVFHHPNDEKSRQDMSLASLFGGLALANAGLGAVHGFAGPIGGMFNAPHGAICARLLPFVMEKNVHNAQKSNNLPVISRYQTVSSFLTQDKSANTEDGIKKMFQICDTLKIPPLANFGISKNAIPEIVQKANKASSMKGNPVHLSEKDLSEILEKAI